MAAVNINRQEFDRLIQGDMPVLAEFWAPWCVYCRRIGPAYDKIAEKYADEINVVKINIDDEPQLAQDERIELVPSLVMYRRGEDIGSIVAPESGVMIEELIKEALSQ